MVFRVDPALEEAWRSSYGLDVSVEAWRGGQLLDLPLDVLEGAVTMTDSPGVRARLRIVFASAPGLWDALAPLGTTLRPVMHFEAGRDEHDVPFGTFDVDDQALVYDGAGRLELECPDLWGRVLSRRLDRAVSPRGNAVDLAVAYAREALGPEVVAQRVSPSPARVWGQVYEEDRGELVEDLLAAAGRIAYLDRNGVLVVAPQPRLVGAQVWDVDSFRGGVLLGAKRSRSRAAVRNRVIVRPAGAARFPQVTVDDTAPSSPTRVSGPMGIRPVFVSNPVIRTAEQARIVAEAKKRRSTGLGAVVEAETAPHWGLDPYDPIGVVLPAQNGDGWAPEQHLIATVTHPLPKKGTAVTQSITTRSTRPDGGDDEVAT